ncbi:hypothetical protein BJV77DRAFT_9482 [Russula vinacea]|nr:hypothetical protein BJV77DRAFT_9482 [Russula vinacea]
MQSIDTLPIAPSDAPGSIATSTSPPLESLLDPFTGVAVGLLSPIPCGNNANGSSEELWAHLTRIRSLQADVARLHLTMEGIGLGTRSRHTCGARPRALWVSGLKTMRTATPGTAAVSRRRSGARVSLSGPRRGSIGGRRRSSRLWPSWVRSRRNSRPFMRSIHRCSIPRQQLRAPQPCHPRLFHFTHITSPRPTSLLFRGVPRGREESFDSPIDIHEPLPIFEEPESAVEHVLPSTSVT